MMATNKYSTYIGKTVEPGVHSGADKALRLHFLRRLAWLTGWLVRQKKGIVRPADAADFELGNERFTGDGYYSISIENIIRERKIDIQTISLLSPRIR